MRLVTSKIEEEVFENRYIFLDNDFLGFISSDTEAFKDTLSLTIKSRLIVDPITRLEFLRDTTRPIHREIRSKFVDDAEVFAPTTEHHTIFNQVRANALLLSYIFKLKGCEGQSIPDLLLAGRILLHQDKTVLITGNRSDFPPVIFDSRGVLVAENKNGSVRVFSIVSLNLENFKKAVEDLGRVR